MNTTFFIIMIVTFSILYLSDKITFDPTLIIISKYLLYFGK